MRPLLLRSSLLAACLLASAQAAFAATATPSAQIPATTLVLGQQIPAAPARPARAELNVRLGRSKAWVGQAIPISVTVRFRDIDGATLEGAPQLVSDSVFTSSLPSDPRQSTQNLGGAPVLVATWKGTITPSSPGPLALTVQVPVKIRFHDAPVMQQQVQPSEPQEDPFQDMLNLDPFDPGSMDRILRSMQRSMPMGFGGLDLGQGHEQTLTLKAAAPSLEVQSLPLVGQPANFSGAVGKFQLRASLGTDSARANEPLTLSVTLQGDGDLDRIQLAGLQTTRDFKAYPLTPKSPDKKPDKAGTQKLFEQVLIPTHGGSLEIPSLKLATFDPTSGHYTEIATEPLRLDVDGPPLAAASSLNPPPRAASTPAARDLSPTMPAQLPRDLVESPRRLALELAPVLALILAGLGSRLLRRRDPESALRRELRRSAKRGNSGPFFEAARRLIAVHFARRWQVTDAAVTPDALRTKLGERAEPLLNVLATAEALRFGRRNAEPGDLVAVCSSLELSLKEAP